MDDMQTVTAEEMKAKESERLTDTSIYQIITAMRAFLKEELEDSVGFNEEDAISLEKFLYEMRMGLETIDSPFVNTLARLIHSLTDQRKDNQ
jgi:hypothetical protein